MEEQLFRKESMERISSPEELQDYMRVTSPGIWMVLAAVVILLAGLLVCASTGKLETVVPSGAAVADGRITAVIDSDSSGEMMIRVAGKEIQVEYSYRDDEGRTVVTAPTDLPDGAYEAEIVTDSVSPISFLLN